MSLDHSERNRRYREKHGLNVAWREQTANDDRQFTPEETEFMLAMDQYKREHNRPFPAWHEVLAV